MTNSDPIRTVLEARLLSHAEEILRVAAQAKMARAPSGSPGTQAEVPAEGLPSETANPGLSTDVLSVDVLGVVEEAEAPVTRELKAGTLYLEAVDSARPDCITAFFQLCAVGYLTPVN